MSEIVLMDELAGSVVRKDRQEDKGVRHVRDAAFWGAPVGTPLPLTPTLPDMPKPKSPEELRVDDSERTWHKIETPEEFRDYIAARSEGAEHQYVFENDPNWQERFINNAFGENALKMFMENNDLYVSGNVLIRVAHVDSHRVVGPKVDRMVPGPQDEEMKKRLPIVFNAINELRDRQPVKGHITITFSDKWMKWLGHDEALGVALTPNDLSYDYRITDSIPEQSIVARFTQDKRNLIAFKTSVLNGTAGWDVQPGWWPIDNMTPYDRTRYLMAHEWGHLVPAIDTGETHTRTDAGTTQYLSEYSKRNNLEETAEAFALWFMDPEIGNDPSKWPTTSRNHLAASYARDGHFGVEVKVSATSTLVFEDLLTGEHGEDNLWRYPELAFDVFTTGAMTMGSETKVQRHVRDAQYWKAPVGTPLPLPAADDRPVVAKAYRGLLFGAYQDFGPDGPTDKEVIDRLWVERRGYYFGPYWTSKPEIAEPFSTGDWSQSYVWFMGAPNDKDIYGVVLEAGLAKDNRPNYSEFVYESEEAVAAPNYGDVVYLKAHLYKRIPDSIKHNGDRVLLRTIDIPLGKGRKELQEMIEVKAVVRRVRDPRYWGKPYGTPIVPGMEPSPERPGIRVHDVVEKHGGGMTYYEGTVDEGQVGYRGVRGSELWGPAGATANGVWRSYGNFTAGPEKSTTMFAASPEELDDPRFNYTHVVEADLGGLTFRTLRKPTDDGQVQADIGLGLGIVDDIPLDRVKKVVSARDGRDATDFFHRMVAAGDQWDEVLRAKEPPVEADYKVRYTDEYSGDKGEGVVEAYVGDELVGVLRWDYAADPPVVTDMSVEEPYRRRGIASRMFDIAKQNESQLQHSDVLTDDGRAFRDAYKYRKKWGHDPVPEPVIPRLKPVHVQYEGDLEQGMTDFNFDYEFREPEDIPALDSTPKPFDPLPTPEELRSQPVWWIPNSDYMQSNFLLPEAFKSVGTNYDVQQERALVKQHVEDRLSQRIWSAAQEDPRLMGWIKEGTVKADEFWDWRGDFKPMGAQAILDTLRSTYNERHANATYVSTFDDGLLTGIGIHDMSEDDSEENYRKIMRLHRIALLLYTPDIGVTPDLMKGITHWGDFEGISDEELFLRTKVKALVDAWAGTSSDGSVPSQAVQMAVTRTFGLGSGTTNNVLINAPKPESVWTYYNGDEPLLTAFVRATYDETQDFFKANGIEQVWAYRGMTFSIRDIPDWALEGMAGEDVSAGISAEIEKERKAFIAKTKRELVKNPVRMQGPLTNMKLREILGVTSQSELRQMEFTDEQYAEADAWARDQIATDPKSAAARLTDLYWQTERGRVIDKIEHGWMEMLQERSTAGRVRTMMNPVSSFSTSHEKAAEFGNHAGYKNSEGKVMLHYSTFGIVLQGAVPRERIWSTAITGNGCLTEAEVIVLGGGDDDWFGVNKEMVVLT
jgi:hypothetical protein